MQLTIKNLNVGYENKPVLSNINLTANSGDFIALIGKNGTGKSTLLKTLAGIIPAISGKFTIDDKNVFKIKDTEKVNFLSVVLTDKIDLPLSVYEFISLGRQAYTSLLDSLSDTDKNIIDKVANDLQINLLLDEKITQISDGERQKVLIARALVQETPVIFLDEPTTHLDLENKAILITLLKKISVEQKKIIIFSTHDLNLIIPKVDKIWLANHTVKGIKQTQNDFQELFSSDYLVYDKDCKKFKLT